MSVPQKIIKLVEHPTCPVKPRQGGISATAREIDQLVYELYGLTEEEIKIVEGGN